MFAGLKCVLPEKRLAYHIMREKIAIETLMDDLPNDEIIKLISFGVFSSIGLIKFVSERTKINELTVSTLAVGAKHIETLDVMAEQGKLGDVKFFVGTIMHLDGERKKKYTGTADRADTLNRICDRHGWSVVVCKNHSKIILMDTDKGKYVVETSSNLNENPKFEQFSFEKNDELFLFYKEFFDGLEEAINESRRN